MRFHENDTMYSLCNRKRTDSNYGCACIPMNSAKYERVCNCMAKIEYKKALSVADL